MSRPVSGCAEEPEAIPPLSGACRHHRPFSGFEDATLVNREILYALAEAKVLVENWRRECSILRPCSSLGCLPPAPEALVAGGVEALDCLEKRTEHRDRSAAEAGAARGKERVKRA